MGCSWRRGRLARHADRMFENFVGAKIDKRRQRTRIIAAISIAVHAGVLLGLLVHGFWQIERLGLPKREISVAIAPALPPPPPPAAPSVKKEPPQQRKDRRLVPPDTTQPVNRPAPDEDVELVPEDRDSLFGVDGGSDQSTSQFPAISNDNMLPGPRIDTPPPPAPLPARPVTVEATVVEAQRVAGQKLIQPDDATKLQMARDGRPRVEATIKMCLSAGGDVTRTDIARSSGYPEYDVLIVRTMQQWQYRPYLVNNQPSAVCTSVKFIYSQQ
jgi:protein TonB